MVNRSKYEKQENLIRICESDCYPNACKSRSV
uniref:Uncharacterized protein n=1 Tax=Arundo donax TaxID=35708 RepID=A0A0A9FTN2_ARUDO